MRKVRILSLLILVVSMLGVFCFSANAAGPFTENGFIYSVDNNGYATIEGLETVVEGEVTIPGNIGGYPVRSFYDTFRNNTKITSVIISEGVSNISYYAFYGCTKLEYVYIPSSVTSIGKEAFRDTKALQEIEVNAGNSRYLSENGILYNKDKTEIFVCPSSCGIETFVFPDSVTKIAAYCFYANVSIKEVIMPENLTEMGEFAFYGSQLSVIQFNDKLLSIPKYAFSSCKNLRSFEIPATLESIGDFAFENCHAITELIIPDGVRTIGKEAFNNCDTLVNIQIGSTAESIGTEAFGNCNKLQSIYVSDGNQFYTSDKNGIFYDINKTILFVAPPCNGMTYYVMPDSVATIEDEAFCYHQTLTTISFSESLKEIGVRAFFSCEELEGEIYFGSSLEIINEDAFHACNYISSFKVNENNQSFSSDDYGALYDKNKTALILYPPSAEAEEYIIPDGVTLIADSAIYNAFYLNKIVIPDSVKTIETNAINHCSLTALVIGKGVCEINTNSFIYSTIKSITVSEENEYFCSDDDVLYDKEKTILYKFPAYNQQVDFVVPDTVNKICSGAFYKTRVENVILPNSVSEIGYYVFNDCFWLATITVVNPNASISTLKQGVVYYGYANSTLEKYCRSSGYDFVPLYDGLSVDYEDGVLILSGTSELPVIDNENMCPWAAFSDSTDCILIRDISLISANAFSDFYDISSVIFESENITVENNAFSDCHELKTVICYSDAEFGEAAFSTQTENLLFFKENNKNVICNYDFITFTYEDGIVSFDKPVTIEHYDFFNLVAALCNRYPEVNELEFVQFTLLNGNMEKIDVNGEEVNRTEISSFENDRLAVQILDEETYDVVTVSFNELCAGVANGEINKFLLVVINEEDEIENEVIVDSDEVKDEESFIVLVFRALITFFNKILRLFKK